MREISKKDYLSKFKGINFIDKYGATNEELIVITEQLNKQSISSVPEFVTAYNATAKLLLQETEKATKTINKLIQEPDDIGDITITYYDKTGKAFKVFKD